MKGKLPLITRRLINKFGPCYDPKEIGFTSDLKLTFVEFIDQFKTKVKSPSDVIWLACRILDDKENRLFAVWCAGRALKRVEQPDIRSVEAIRVAEQFAQGKATLEELSAAERAAWSAAERAAWSAARSAARSAAWSAAERAAWSAARSAAWGAAESAEQKAQIAKLRRVFKRLEQQK